MWNGSVSAVRHRMPTVHCERCAGCSTKQKNGISSAGFQNLLTEHGRSLRLDDDAEQKLLVAAKACNWTPGTFDLFRDIIIVARDTGMRNQRELYRIRMENLDWNNRIIFVPDSKTADGRRMIPMSDRVSEVLRTRTGGRSNSWFGQRR